MIMDTLKSLLERLFKSWTAPGKVDPGLFTDDFIYDCGSELIPTEVWLSADTSDAPLIDVRLVGIEAEEEACEGRLRFEFIDPITLLHHRVDWYVRCRDGLIAVIKERDPASRYPGDVL